MTTKTKPETKAEGQLELVKVTPAQKREKVTNLIAEYRVEKFRREALLGEAKLHKNRMKELLEEAEKLSVDASTGQVQIELRQLIEQAEDDGDDLEGRVFDQSNIKKVEDLVDMGDEE
jgi:hypothetical protein